MDLSPILYKYACMMFAMTIISLDGNVYFNLIKNLFKPSTSDRPSPVLCGHVWCSPVLLSLPFHFLHSSNTFCLSLIGRMIRYVLYPSYHILSSSQDKVDICLNYKLSVIILVGAWNEFSLQLLVLANFVGVEELEGAARTLDTQFHQLTETEVPS